MVPPGVVSNTGERLTQKLKSTMTPAAEGKLKEAVALNTEIELMYYEIRGKGKSVTAAQAEFFEKKQAVEGLHGEILPPSSLVFVLFTSRINNHKWLWRDEHSKTHCNRSPWCLTRQSASER
eukprot:SAG22_NODE_779_length_7272_cov_146.237418_2_plen_122_part_00